MQGSHQAPTLLKLSNLPCLCLFVQVIRQQHIHQRLTNILGDMVTRERGGEIVDKALLRSITQVRHSSSSTPGGGGPGCGSSSCFLLASEVWTQSGRTGMCLHTANHRWLSAALRCKRQSTVGGSPWTVHVDRVALSLTGCLCVFVLCCVPPPQMLMDLGKPTYEADFEQAFLADAAEFYKKEAAEFLSQNNAPDYLRKVRGRAQARLVGPVGTASIDSVASLQQLALEPRVQCRSSYRHLHTLLGKLSRVVALATALEPFHTPHMVPSCPLALSHRLSVVFRRRLSVCVPTWTSQQSPRSRGWQRRNSSPSRCAHVLPPRLRQLQSTG